MGNFPDVPWLFFFSTPSESLEFPMWYFFLRKARELSNKSEIKQQIDIHFRRGFRETILRIFAPSQRRQRSINFFLPSRKRRKISSFSFCVNNSWLFRTKDLDHSGGDEWLYVTTLRIFFRPRHVSNSLYGKRLLLLWLFQASFHVIFRLSNDIYTAIHIMQ